MIEANWLWDFFQRLDDGKSLLSRAQILADMPLAEKIALRNWAQTVSALNMQFQPGMTEWTVLKPSIAKSAWMAFKELMAAFYEKGLRSGLPYLPNGTPVAIGGVTYADYVKDFRDAHRLTPHLDAREVCVLCGGPLGDTPHVDHWITKSAFPLLSVCANNLQLICSTCNEAPNKGDKPVHTAGIFVEWFHPYLRPGSGALQLDYALLELAIRCNAIQAIDQPKADNLNSLLNLSDRWTREFKAEYVKQQNVLRGKERRRIQQAQPAYSQAEIQDYVREWQADLQTTEPHYEVHQALASALLEFTRLEAWRDELRSF